MVAQREPKVFFAQAIPYLGIQSLTQSNSFPNVERMEAKNTKYCPTCKGTQWHNNSLCFACEVTLSQAKAIVSERARTGKSTPTDALAAIEEFEAHSLATQARQLGVAV